MVRVGSMVWIFLYFLLYFLYFDLNVLTFCCNFKFLTSSCWMRVMFLLKSARLCRAHWAFLFLVASTLLFPFSILDSGHYVVSHLVCALRWFSNRIEASGNKKVVSPSRECLIFRRMLPLWESLNFSAGERERRWSLTSIENFQGSVLELGFGSSRTPS